MVDATRPAGQWNHVYLRVAPTNCEVAINGISYYYFRMGSTDWKRRVAASKFAQHSEFGLAGRGHICLQDHGDAVSFRNIKLRALAEDGSVSDPVDGTLPVEAVVAFPGLKWDGWEPIDARGKVQRMRPMVITHADDGSNRLFVATQRGAIHVFPNTPDTRRTQMFLDLSSKVSDWNSANEEGLLGMALHPKFADNGRFYVYYSARTRPRMSIVSEFRVATDDPNRADVESERIVMRIPQPYPNHNGGSIAFGPDGFLYIALGDGGGRNDPLANGQNLSTWMGSILRIDIDRRDTGRGYGIPRDNPFTARAAARPEIFAYGLRNVWRMSFDRQTGHLWAGDVGQDLWEEINLIQAGGNYGWSIREAVYEFGNAPAMHRDETMAPIWEYDHQVGKSITGGLVYRGKKIPQLAGRYVYADFVTGKVWALKYDYQQEQVVSNMAITTDRMPVLAFGDDEAGEIYLTIESVDGRFYRLQKKSRKSATP
jgi:glucose/arabinose dehydrogenase